jgi:HAD superfamily hydrolase (TIGR01509 family)
MDFFNNITYKFPQWCLHHWGALHPTSPRRETSLFNSPGLVPGFFLDFFMRPSLPRALLFDIDGTLADTDIVHLQAFNNVFGEYGHQFDKDRYKREIQGFTNQSIGDRFFPDMSDAQKKSITDKKEHVFRTMAHTGLEPLAGLVDLLDWADAHDIPMAAVTNAPTENADHILSAIGVKNRFRAIIIGSSLPHGKPHPMPYLEGLSRLGLDSAEGCFAFEDSRTGIQSSTAANLFTVGIMTSLTSDELTTAGANLAVARYDDSRLNSILGKTS